MRQLLSISAATIVLGASGPIRTGEVVTVRCRRAAGGTSGLLLIGGAPDNQPSIVGGDVIVSPIVLFPVVFAGTPGLDGAGKLDLPFGIPLELAGVVLYSQCFAFDAASPTGFAVSNGLALVFGAP